MACKQLCRPLACSKVKGRSSQGAFWACPLCEGRRGLEVNLLICIDGADVGQLLLADWVDFKVRLPGTLPHDLQCSSQSAPIHLCSHINLYGMCLKIDIVLIEAQLTEIVSRKRLVSFMKLRISPCPGRPQLRVL